MIRGPMVAIVWGFFLSFFLVFFLFRAFLISGSPGQCYQCSWMPVACAALQSCHSHLRRQRGMPSRIRYLLRVAATSTQAVEDRNMYLPFLYSSAMADGRFHPVPAFPRRQFPQPRAMENPDKRKEERLPPASGSGNPAAGGLLPVGGLHRAIIPKRSRKKRPQADTSDSARP